MSTPAEVVSYITGKGWAVKGREKWAGVGVQLVLDCPLCGKKSDGEQRRFYISEATGQWKTFCCQRDGNLITLMRAEGDLDVKLVNSAGMMHHDAKGIGQRMLATRSGAAALSLVTEKHELPASGRDEEYHAALMAPDGAEALAYLMAGPYIVETPEGPKDKARGLHLETVVAAKLGYRKDDSTGLEWIAIPWYLPDGKLAGFKYRVLPRHETASKVRFRREKGAPTVLYGAHLLASSPAPVVTLYEGEIDRLSGNQMGLPMGLASTAGAGTWLPEWTALLAGVDTILIAYDDDAGGEAGAEKVAEELGRWRCRRVRLPRHDMNECVAPATAVDPVLIAEAVALATPFGFDSLQDAGAFGELVDLDPVRAIGSDPVVDGFKEFMAGVRGGEITVLTGESGHGKTTFSTYWAWRLAEAGHGPTGIASPEQLAVEEAMKLATMEAGGSFLKLDKPGRLHVLSMLARRGVYVHKAFGKVTKKALFDTLRYFYRACGGKLFVIDHLGFFAGEEDGGSQKSAVDRIDKFMEELHDLLRLELRGLHVVLVAHPRNVGDGRDGAQVKIRMRHLKGSSGIRQFADNVMIVERAERKDGKLRAYITFEKVRSMFGECGEVLLAFDKDSLRYSRPSAPAAPAPPTLPPAASVQATIASQLLVGLSGAPSAAPAPAGRKPRAIGPSPSGKPRQRRKDDAKKAAANDTDDTDEE